MEDILLLDIISFLFLNNLGSDEFDWFWLFITDKRQTIFFFLIVTTLLFRKFNWRKIIFLYLTIAILITMSDQTSNWFKDYFLRLRPCHEESIKSLLRLVKSSCGGKYGFFSAHASNTFALSIFLINLFSKEIKLIYFLIIYSLFVAYSRIYLGVHYPLDVLFGIGVGFFYGFSISVISKKLFIRFNNFRIRVYKFNPFN